MSELESIQGLLSQSKQDRSKPLEPRFVAETYKRFDHAVTALESPEKDPVARNVLHMLSLALVTVGMSRAAPSQYAMLLTLHRLLLHLELRPMFTLNEAKVVRHHLNSVRDGLERAQQPQSELQSELQVGPGVRQMVLAQLEECSTSLDIIQGLLTATPEEDIHLYSQVIHLRREIFNFLAEESFKPSYLDAPRSKVLQIEHHLENTNHQPSWMLRHHIEACKFSCEYYANGPVCVEELKSEYDRLLQIQRELTVLLVTRRYTSRETDLYNYQRELAQLDAKVVFAFKNSGNSALPELDAPVQEIQNSLVAAGPYLVLFFLVRKSHSLIYKLLENAEPITEALQPIFNQLTTTKRCLLDVKRVGGLSNLQELYPYQMQLCSVEKKRTGGNFMVAGDIPPGQGTLNNLLAECYDLVYELEVDLEERPQSDNEDLDEDNALEDNRDECDPDECDPDA